MEEVYGEFVDNKTLPIDVAKYLFESGFTSRELVKELPVEDLNGIAELLPDCPNIQRPAVKIAIRKLVRDLIADQTTGKTNSASDGSSHEEARTSPRHQETEVKPKTQEKEVKPKRKEKGVKPKSQAKQVQLTISPVDENSPLMDLGLFKSGEVVHIGNMLRPAPSIISLLNQLIVHSTRVHVKLTKPTNGFKKVQYPDSFGASLLQLSNLAFAAFREGHSNMDKIQMKISLVPHHLKTIMKLIEDDNPTAVLKRLLPAKFALIGKATKDCRTYAKASEGKFQEVIELITELSEAARQTRDIQEQTRRENEKMLKLLHSEQEKKAEMAANMEKEYKESAEFIKRQRAKYEEAVDEYQAGKTKHYSGVAGLFRWITFGNKTTQEYNKDLPQIVEKRNKDLESAETKLKDSFDNYDKFRKELDDAEKLMAELSLSSDINLTDIEGMLSKVLDVLTKVHKNWNELMLYFTSIADRTEIINEMIIEPTTQEASVKAELMDDYKSKEVLILQLAENGRDIRGACFFLKMLADTYVEVSQKFILANLMESAEYLNANPNNRQKFIDTIQLNTKEAIRGIDDIVQKQEDNYKKQFAVQRLEIEYEMKESHEPFVEEPDSDDD